MQTFAARDKKHSATRNVRSPNPEAFSPVAVAQHQVRQILRTPDIQAKLSVGAPTDIHEQEADRCADQVLTILGPVRQTESTVIQRQETGLESKGGSSGPAFPMDKVHMTIREDAKPLPPELQGKRKAYFLVTYEKSEFEKMYTSGKSSEKESIQDEMEYLKSAGYLVVYIEFATEKDITTAFADPNAVLIFSTGHGDPPGTIRTTNEEHVEPGEIKIPAGSNLKQVILEHCNVGDQAEKWQKVLPKDAELTTWTGQTTTKESVQFNSEGGIGDRQWGTLMSRVKTLPQLENQQGDIYRITEKGEKEIIKNLETGEVKPSQPAKESFAPARP